MVSFTSEHYSIEQDPALPVLKLVRTEKPFRSIIELEAAVAAVNKACIGTKREQFLLFADLRKGPIIDDPEAEKAMNKAVKTLTRGFHKVVALVRTPSGRTQVTRRTKEAEETNNAIFFVEDVAWEYIRANLPQP
jgi:hypothetical protein